MRLRVTFSVVSIFVFNRTSRLKITADPTKKNNEYDCGAGADSGGDDDDESSLIRYP